MKYSFVCKLIPTRFVDGKWRVFPSSILTDPSKESDWVRLFPLRVSIISDKSLKAGCATNPKEFSEIMAAVGEKARIEYKVGARAERENAPAPRFGTRRPEQIYGASAQ